MGVTFTSKRKIGTRHAQRCSQKLKTMVSNGYHRDEEAAARASDTFARKLMKNGESHFLNFAPSSNYIGVTYNKKYGKWEAQRWNQDTQWTNKNGAYADEETAAHASDTLARILMGTGRQKHRLNFPNDLIDVYPNVTKKLKSSSFLGVYYRKESARWVACRLSKKVKKMMSYGTYKDEETAARASDALAIKLVQNGEKNHKLNFPDDTVEFESQMKKRKGKNTNFGASANSEDVEVVSKDQDDFQGLEIDTSSCSSQRFISEEIKP